MEIFKFGGKKDTKGEENKQEIKPTENNEEFSKKVKALKERFSSIKFPAEFEVKLTNRHSESSPLHFLVKKEGAPNEVSIIAWAGHEGEDIPVWEIMANGVYGDSIIHISLDDTEGLIKAIEEDLYLIPHDEDDDQEDFKSLPIKKIRNAVEEKSSQLAKKESIDKPEERHYKEAFDYLKEARADSESMYLAVVEWLSDKKDLKEKMGPELEKEYTNLVEKTRKEYERWILNSAAEIIKKGPPPMKALKEIGKLISETTDDVIEKIKDNYIIREALKDKPDVMNRVLRMTDQETKVYYDGFLSGGKSSLAKYQGE